MHDLNFVSAKQGQPLRCACGLLPSSDLIRWTKLDRVGTSNVVVYCNFDDIYLWPCCSLQDTVVRVDHQQQHLRRLKLQRSDEADYSLPTLVRRQQQQAPADIDNGLPNSPWDFSRPLNHHKDKRDHQQACHGVIWSWVKFKTIPRNCIEHK